MATVTFSAAGETLYAYLAGEIDHDTAQSLRMQLDDALVSRSPRTLIIDLGGVGFMDSSGIGLILGRQRCARVLGTSLRLQHAPCAAAKSPAAGGHPLYGEYRKGECAMKAENSTRVQFDSLSSNEAYARGVTAAFLARYDPNRAAAGRPENGGIRGGDQLHRPRLPGADRAGVHDHCGLPRPGGAHHHYR